MNKPYQTIETVSKTQLVTECPDTISAINFCIVYLFTFWVRIFGIIELVVYKYSKKLNDIHKGFFPTNNSIVWDQRTCKQF